MAGILKHRYVNPHADVAGSTKTQASHWNDFLMATGGNQGDALTRDTSDATYGMKWTGGGVAGVWQAVPFDAANFAATSPMTCTVSSGNVAGNRYTVIGKLLTWSLYINAMTLGGTASNSLLFTIPGGFSMQYYNPGTIAVCGTGTGADTRAYANLVTATQIGIYRLPTVNFDLGASGYLGFTIAIEIL